jgi:UDP-glucose 4-epimerase
MAGLKRYLITGSRGYIGENMSFKDWVDDKLKKHPDTRNLDLREPKDVHFYDCDYNTDLPPAHRLNEDIVKHYDGVIHLAALSGIFACEEDPWRAVKDNVSAAGNVFDICAKLGIPVIFTSSQAAKTPHTSFYANMKWTCETMANYFNQHGGKNYVVRLANVYGGYKYLKKKQTCVKQFITQYQIDRPFQIHGDGQQERDFVHVYDVCEAIYKIMTIQPDYFDPIDIGTGKGISILDLRQMFPSHPVEFTDSRNAGAKSSVADTSVLKELVGFVPMRELQDYIKEMI